MCLLFKAVDLCRTGESKRGVPPGQGVPLHLVCRWWVLQLVPESPLTPGPTLRCQGRLQPLTHRTKKALGPLGIGLPFPVSLLQLPFSTSAFYAERNKMAWSSSLTTADLAFPTQDWSMCADERAFCPSGCDSIWEGDLLAGILRISGEFL